MKIWVLACLMGCIVVTSFGESSPLVLKASKDNFGRSNKRNRNSGASETLAIAHAPNIRTLIAFDLSSVTNEIVGAELRFRQHTSMPDKISLVIAPMVNTTNNAVWIEGSGNLGTGGQNAEPGESCYAYSAFRTVPWESASGKPLMNLGDPKLWQSPVATFNGLEWQENRWVSAPVKGASLLEKIRNSKTPTITFGLWGTAGNGLYFISSNNTQWAPELHLTLKE